MARRSWHNAGKADSVRVVPKDGVILYGSTRYLHPRTPPGLGECLLYPMTDGPGVGLLIFLPPVLLFLSLPVFDVVAIVKPLTRGDWALGLLALPILSPLLVTFTLVFGYGLLCLGQMFVASALGEPDHPRWPEWDAGQIAEGLTRWAWAAVFGLALGGFPIVVYWLYCGDIDWFDRVVFADLIILATGYGLMALAAALLHDSLVLANPATVLSAVVQVGWDFVMPCVFGGLSVMLVAGLAWSALFWVASLKLAVLSLWGAWVAFLYLTMVSLRMVGLTYHAHANELVWFTGRPRWGTPSRFGRLYSNS